MSVCRYCGRQINRPLASECKDCLTEVYVYEQSVKRFEQTPMEKEAYYRELKKMARTAVIRKYFELESGGAAQDLQLRPGEVILALSKNVKYLRDHTASGPPPRRPGKPPSGAKWHAVPERADTGLLFATDQRLLFLGTRLRIVKEYAALAAVEDYNGTGIALPLEKNWRGETITVRQYFNPCFDCRYLAQKAHAFLRGESGAAKAVRRVRRPAPVKGRGGNQSGGSPGGGRPL